MLMIDLFLKILTCLYLLNGIYKGFTFNISRERFLWQYFSNSTNICVTLILVFDLLFENFNLDIAYMLCTVCSKALMLSTALNVTKAFSALSKLLILWPWRWYLTYYLNTLTAYRITSKFWTASTMAFTFHVRAHSRWECISIDTSLTQARKGTYSVSWQKIKYSRFF